MEKKVSHRSSEDEKWQSIKKEVLERDGCFCRCCRVMTPSELGIRNKLNLPNYLFQILDPAHYHSVGGHVEETYNIDNLYTLCRPCHDALDSYRSPVTGKMISREEHEEWWQRIINYKKAETSSINELLDDGLKSERFDPDKWLDGEL